MLMKRTTYSVNIYNYLEGGHPVEGVISQRVSEQPEFRLFRQSCYCVQWIHCTVFSLNTDACRLWITCMVRMPLHLTFI